VRPLFGFCGCCCRSFAGISNQCSRSAAAIWRTGVGAWLRCQGVIEIVPDEQTREKWDTHFSKNLDSQ
jgi:hypothetical protein